MLEVPIQEALLLWDSGLNGDTPRFAVRQLGDEDYYRFSYQGGACLTAWLEEADTDRLKFRLMIQVWHIAAFYGVPVDLMKPELLRIPEYRDMLADDVLPRNFQRPNP